MKYRAEIDGLRAIAVVPVILFHAGAPWFPGGFVGVDVFFVISGYLITGILLQDIVAGRFSVWSFYERRFRRIVPALVAMCAATVPFAFAWLIPSDLADYGRSLVATALSVSNFYFRSQVGYFAPDASLQPLIHTWSLAVEEQFYLIFPLLLAILARHRTRAVLALALASFVLSVVMSYRGPSENFYLLPTRFWELAAGALLALTAAEIRRPVAAEAIAGAGILLILLSAVLLDGDVAYPGLWTLPPVMGTLMVLATGSATLVARLLSLRPLVGIGLISYSLYLWHQPIFAFARIRLLGHVTPEIYAGLTMLALAIAYASWRFVERPFRDRTWLSRRQVFGGTVAACSLLAAFGIASDLTRGFPDRQGGKFAELARRARHNVGLPGCAGRFPVPEACKTDAAPEIIVWGDSFAQGLVAGIIASNPSVRLIQFTKSSCGPLPGLSNIPPNSPASWPRDCIAFNDAAKAFIEKTPSIRFAVLSSSFRQYANSPGFLEGEQVVPGDPATARAHLAAAIAWLRSQGVTPVLFVPPPRDGTNIGACLRYATWVGASLDRCNLSVAGVRASTSGITDMIAGLDVATVNAAGLLCDRDTCRTHVGDTILYNDGGHLSVEGSTYLGKTLGFYDRIIEAVPRAALNR